MPTVKNVTHTGPVGPGYPLDLDNGVILRPGQSASVGTDATWARTNAFIVSGELQLTDAVNPVVGPLAPGGFSSVDNATLEVVGGVLRIKDGGVTPAKLSYAAPRNIFRSGLIYSQSVATVAGVIPANNRQYWTPIFLPKGQVFDVITINFTVAGQAGCSARLGLYDDLGDCPNNLISEFGTVLLDGVPADMFATANWTVPANGLYWMSAAFQNGATTQATVLHNASGAPGTARNVNQQSGGYFLAGVTGAMANAGAIVLPVAQTGIQNVPRIGLRAA